MPKCELRKLPIGDYQLPIAELREPSASADFQVKLLLQANLQDNAATSTNGQSPIGNRQSILFDLVLSTT